MVRATVWYSVTSLGENIGLQDELTMEEFETSLEAIIKRWMLAWALVYPTVQG